MKVNYQFAWINRNTKKPIYQDGGEYTSIGYNPSIYEYPKYWLNIEAEKHWTIFLLDRMEKTIEENGYLEFIILPWTPFVRIGLGYITFLKENEKFTYKFDEISKIYIKGTDLYIEHKNFEKILFFFKSGNQNKIPLQMLCNRQFFFKALEILVGHKVT